MTEYLEPTAPVAPTAILTGDPRRAMELATRVLEAPRMSNLSRGLWGYFGTTKNGTPLTVQSTGLGATSAAAVLHELGGLGVREAVRVGSCRSLRGGPALGEVVVVASAVASDGVSAALAAGAQPVADPRLRARLEAALPGAQATGVVAGINLVHDQGERAVGERRRWADAGAHIADTCTAALLAVGGESGLAIGATLVVSEAEAGAGDRPDDGTSLDREAREHRLLELGVAVAELLAG